jgi:hypothetical protein
MMKRVLVPATVMAALALCGCNPRGVANSDYGDSGSRGISATQGVTGDGRGMSFGGDGSGNARAQAVPTAVLGVNAYLWSATLDTLAFMPLASADPFGGVIITSWYEPPAKEGERFKATAYIMGRQLRADGIKVSLFRQVSEGGRWVDKTVSPITVSEIENKILARARELRAQNPGS